VFAADTLLPREGEKSDLVGAKLVKEAVVLGAAAGLVISRHDPKAVAFGWSMIGGLVAADGVHALSGSPRFAHYASEHEASPATAPSEPAPPVHGTDRDVRVARAASRMR
jgi:hypothetical protein